MGEYQPIHQQVWEKLDKLSYENYQLKRRITRLEGRLRDERRKNEKLRKGERQHYRNNPRGRVF